MTTVVRSLIIQRLLVTASVLALATPALAMTPLHQVTRPWGVDPSWTERQVLEDRFGLGSGPSLRAVALFRERPPIDKIAQLTEKYPDMILNCSGTFIVPGIVLTAAHCFLGNEPKRPETPFDGLGTALVPPWNLARQVRYIYRPLPSYVPQWFVAQLPNDGLINPKWQFRPRMSAGSMACPPRYHRPESAVPETSFGRVTAVAVLRDPWRAKDPTYDSYHDLALALVEPAGNGVPPIGAGDFAVLPLKYLTDSYFGTLLTPQSARFVLAVSARIQQSGMHGLQTLSANEADNFFLSWGSPLLLKATSCENNYTCNWAAMLGHEAVMAGLTFTEFSNKVKCEAVAPNRLTCEQLAQGKDCGDSARTLEGIRHSALVHEAATPLMGAYVVYKARRVASSGEPNPSELGVWVQHSEEIEKFAATPEVRGGPLYDPLARFVVGRPQKGDSGGGLWMREGMPFTLAGVLHAGEPGANNCEDIPGLSTRPCSIRHVWTPIHPHLDWIKKGTCALLWWHQVKQNRALGLPSPSRGDLPADSPCR